MSNYIYIYNLIVERKYDGHRASVSLSVEVQ